MWTCVLIILLPAEVIASRTIDINESERCRSRGGGVEGVEYPPLHPAMYPFRHKHRSLRYVFRARIHGFLFWVNALVASYRVALVFTNNVTPLFPMAATRKVLSRIPKHFSSMENAVAWHVKTGAVRNSTSAAVVVPSRLKDDGENPPPLPAHAY